MRRMLTARGNPQSNARSHKEFWIPVPTIRYLDPESFVNAIAPKGDLTKIGRTQFAILFRVADTSRRGLVSWDDFTVFETLLKRPDADYWMAFQYFDVYVVANKFDAWPLMSALVQRSFRVYWLWWIQDRLLRQHWPRRNPLWLRLVAYSFSPLNAFL